jgi:O-antigen/teichoic acid export membrane protein
LSTAAPSASARRLTLNVVAMVVGKMAAVVIGLATIALLTRHLGPEGFGHYRTVLTVLAVAAICSDLGLQMVVLREVSRPGQDAGHVLGSALALRMILTSLAVIGVGIAALFLPYPEIVMLGVFIAAPYYITLQCSFLLGAFFLKHLRQDQLMAGEVLGGVVMLAGLGLALWLGQGVIGALLAMVAGGAAQFALLWFWAQRLEPFSLRIDPKTWRFFLFTGLPIAGSEIALMIILRGDILLLSILDTATAVGLYGVPSKIFEILGSLTTLFAGMMMPLFVAALAAKRAERLNETLGNALDVMLIFGGGVIACCLAFSTEIVELVAGGAFSSAAPVLLLIAVAIAGHSLAQIYRHLLTAMNRPELAMRVDLVGMVLAIALYVVLIRWYSHVGAGIATALVECGLALGLAWMLRRQGIEGVLPRAWFKVVIATIVVGIGMNIAAANGLHWLLVMPLGGIAYLGLLVLSSAIPLAYLKGMMRKDALPADGEIQPALR